VSKKVQTVHICVNYAHGVIFSNVIVNTFWQQCDLIAIRPSYNYIGTVPQEDEPVTVATREKISATA